MPSTIIKNLSLGILCNLLLVGSAYALHANETETSNEPSIKTLEILDSSQEAISQRIIRFSNWLDSFFGEPRFFQETPENYLQVNFQSLIQDENSPRYRAEFKGKISLPNTEEKIKLLIESEPEDGGVEDGQDTPLKALESQEQTVGLRYIHEPIGHWSVNTDAGVRLRSSLDTFARFRVRRLFPLKKWNLRAAETLFWFDSSGSGSTTRLDLERVVDSQLFFRASSMASWLEENRYFDLRQEFALFHDLDSRRAIAYQFATSGKSKPEAHVTNHQLSVRLRQQIHRDWLFLELNPQINFPKDKQFHAVKSISFTLEFLFGSH